MEKCILGKFWKNSIALSDNLKEQIENSKYSLNVSLTEAEKHYDAMEMNIDKRADSLIGLIRESLHKEIK